MKRFFRKLSPALLPVSIAACSLFPPTLVEQGIVSLEIQKSRPVYIRSVTVYQQENELVVRGSVRRLVCCGVGPISGHVDIIIESRDIQPIEILEVELRGRRRPKHYGRVSDFVVRRTLEVAKGTTIKVRYHEGRHRAA